MQQNILLPLALLLAINSSHAIASQQLLSEMYSALDFDPSRKLLLRLLPLLSPQQRDFLKNIA